MVPLPLVIEKTSASASGAVSTMIVSSILYCMPQCSNLNNGLFLVITGFDISQAYENWSSEICNNIYFQVEHCFKTILDIDSEIWIFNWPRGPGLQPSASSNSYFSQKMSLSIYPFCEILLFHCIYHVVVKFGTRACVLALLSFDNIFL